MFKGLLIYVKIKGDLQGDISRIHVALPVIVFLLILHKIYRCFMQNHLARFAKLSGVLQMKAISAVFAKVSVVVAQQAKSRYSGFSREMVKFIP
nr:MAG TPA: hypothetical protein [Caudoviricetes sp.]